MRVGFIGLGSPGGAMAGRSSHQDLLGTPGKRYR